MSECRECNGTGWIHVPGKAHRERIFLAEWDGTDFHHPRTGVKVKWQQAIPGKADDAELYAHGLVGYEEVQRCPARCWVSEVAREEEREKREAEDLLHGRSLPYKDQ